MATSSGSSGSQMPPIANNLLHPNPWAGVPLQGMGGMDVTMPRAAMFLSGDVTPPSKPRFEVLRNVWGPMGEPGAPQRGKRLCRRSPRNAGEAVEALLTPSRLIVDRCLDTEMQSAASDSAARDPFVV